VRKITIKREAISNAISFRPIVDQKRLGARLKGARSKVVAAIEALDKEALLKFDAEGEMTIEGHVISREDVNVYSFFTSIHSPSLPRSSVVILLNRELLGTQKF
jgi:hypothetical protein